MDQSLSLVVNKTQNCTHSSNSAESRLWKYLCLLCLGKQFANEKHTDNFFIRRRISMLGVLLSLSLSGHRRRAPPPTKRKKSSSSVKRLLQLALTNLSTRLALGLLRSAEISRCVSYV